MLWVWILAIVTVLSFVLEWYLSYQANNWHGLVLPAVFLAAGGIFLVLNLLNVFPQTEAFGSFLALHGTAGAFAVFLKAGFLLTPGVIHGIIYLVCKLFYRKNNQPAKHNKQYKKMLANDL